mmetsp:Transcript_131108/g.238455  ORF Transcript_131108/g.238455 Transcript_131108/m.238455 type:complete len:113 (-) Transcript_131108:135-473(-)
MFAEPTLLGQGTAPRSRQDSTKAGELLNIEAANIWGCLCQISGRCSLQQGRVAKHRGEEVFCRQQWRTSTREQRKLEELVQARRLSETPIITEESYSPQCNRVRGILLDEHR